MSGVRAMLAYPIGEDYTLDPEDTVTILALVRQERDAELLIAMLGLDE